MKFEQFVKGCVSVRPRGFQINAAHTAHVFALIEPGRDQDLQNEFKKKSLTCPGPECDLLSAAVVKVLSAVSFGLILIHPAMHSNPLFYSKWPA